MIDRKFDVAQWLEGKKFVLPLLFVFLTLFTGIAAAEEVADVRATGNARIGESSIIRTFGIRPGDEWSAAEVSEGIRNLYTTRQFRSIAVERERDADGSLILVVVVEERPLLGSYEATGNDKIDDDDLFEETLLKTGLVLSERTLFREQIRISALYEEKGYRNASVSWEEAGLDSAGRTNVRIAVNEGKKVKVKRVVVVGAKSVDEGKIRKKMKTKADSWIRSGDFKEEEFEEDKNRIRLLYGKLGFLDVRIDSTSVVTADNGRDLTVSIYLTEGNQYAAGEFKFDGNEEFENEFLQEAISLRSGEVFDQEKYQESVGNLYSVYSEEGFIFANIVPTQDMEGDTVHTTFRITEGKPAKIRKVNISGNIKTKERTIRRELVVAPGDLFKRSRIIRSQRELFQLGFFQDVRFDYHPVRGKEGGTDEIDIAFEVEERQTGEASMGAGFSSLNGATGFLRLSQVNLFGGGERANLVWEFGNFQQIELSYTEPWLFDTPTRAGVDVAKVRRNWDTFIEHRQGGGIRLGRRLPWLDYSRVDTQYRIEERKIEAESDASESVRNAAGTTTISSTRVTFTRNSTDRLFHPTRGSVNILTSEWAGLMLGGSTEYQQYEAETRWYYPTFWKFFLSLRARLGVVDGYGNPSTVPLYKRYRLGGTGIWGLRGYDDRDLVPEGNAFDFGGRSMLVVTAEHKFPIAQDQIFGLLFFDAGNTWNSFRELRPNDLKRGVGVGIRFQIPMLGQLGFDMGYALDKLHPDDERGWEPHFQLGSMF